MPVIVASDETEVALEAAELFALEEAEVLDEPEEQPASATMLHSKKALMAKATIFVKRDVMFFKSIPFIERNYCSPLARNGREWRPREDSNLRRTV